MGAGLSPASRERFRPEVLIDANLELLAAQANGDRNVLVKGLEESMRRRSAPGSNAEVRSRLDPDDAAAQGAMLFEGVAKGEGGPPGGHAGADGEWMYQLDTLDKQHRSRQASGDRGGHGTPRAAAAAAAATGAADPVRRKS